MITEYALFKLLHILVAIIALGTSAGLGIVLEFYGDDRTHGTFVLRAINRLVVFVVIPGYVLMLGTGLWLTHLSWTFKTKWIQVALVLWLAGAILLAASLVALRKQLVLLETSGPISRRYRQVSALSRL